jgi:hypothetical protein
VQIVEISTGTCGYLVVAVFCKEKRYQEHLFLVIFEKLKQKNKYAGESKYRMERVLER